MKDLKEWMNVRVQDLKVSGIERGIGCPRGTIDKWLKGERQISEHWLVCLRIWLMWFVSDSEIRNENVKVLEKEFKKEKVEKLKEIVVNDKMKIQSENVKEVVAMDKIIVADKETGEIKKETKIPEIKWSFHGLPDAKRVEGNIFSDGVKFAVRKYFGSIEKFAIVDDLETARLIK